jgi:hypothetical protein
MFLHVAKVYDHTLDAKALYKIAKELVTAFKDVLFVSGATLAAYLAITKGAKSNPLTYILGMALDGIFTYFIVSAIGHTFSYYCANNLTWKHEKEAVEVMRNYVKKHIHEMFLDKLPRRYKDKILEQLNPDLVT